MEWLTVADAATRLGVTESRVYQLRSAGALARNDAGHVALADVRKFERVRWYEATSKLGGELKLAVLAEGVRERLHPKNRMTAVLSSGVDAIPSLPGDVRVALGLNNLTAAAAPDEHGCRWCWSNISYRVHGGVDPDDSPVFRALFASQPCPRDIRRWQERAVALVASGAASELRREQHERQQRENRREAEVEAAKQRIRRDTAIVAANTARTVTASVRPRESAGDTDGADLVTAQRAKLMAQLRAAEQRGDTRRHSELIGQIRRLGA
jgi:hypothetical protein